MRELAEEIGTDRAEIIGEHPAWLSYDLPPELIGKALGGRYRGQRQRWFALRFTGEDSDIRLDLDPHPEFDAWRWDKLVRLPELAIGFKRDIYVTLAEVIRRVLEGLVRTWEDSVGVKICRVSDAAREGTRICRQWEKAAAFFSGRDFIIRVACLN